MKRRWVIVLPLLLCFLFALSSCSLTSGGPVALLPTPSAPPVTPPVRKAASEHVDYDRFYSFTEAYLAADAVYAVTVGDWLKEDCEKYDVTYFKAKVDQVIKGSEQKEIVLAQMGTSKGYYGKALFTAGNRLLLFLGEWTRENEYENQYSILCDPFTICYIVEIEGGEQYVVTGDGMLSESENRSSMFWQTVRGADPETRNAVYSAWIASDPIFEDVHQGTLSMYRLDDMIAYFKTPDGE